MDTIFATARSPANDKRMGSRLTPIGHVSVFVGIRLAWAVTVGTRDGTTSNAVGASTSQQQAQMLTFFVNPPLTLLSGVTSPLENMPDFFQKLSYLDPLRYMVTIVRGVTLKNAPWSALWPNLLALVTFAILLFSFSAWRFRKQ